MKRRYLNHTHEHVFHFTKEGAVPLDRLAVGVPFKDKSNIARWGHARDRRCAGDVWFIPYETIRSNRSATTIQPLPGPSPNAASSCTGRTARSCSTPSSASAPR